MSSEPRSLASIMHQWRFEVGGYVCRHPADDISDCDNDADWLNRRGVEAVAAYRKALADQVRALLEHAMAYTKERAGFEDGIAAVLGLLTDGAEPPKGGTE